MQIPNKHISNVNIGNTDTSHFAINLGKKRYELTNHLGNVLSVISDKPIPHDDGSGNADYWQADILSSYDYSPFGVMLSGRTFEKEELVQVCHDSTTLTTLTVLNENFSSWFTWTATGSALLTYVDGEMQVSNPNNSKQNIGASKTFTTGSGVHSVSFDITDNSCSNIQLWPPALIPVPINVYVRDNSNNIVALGSYTVAGNYNLSFTPTTAGLTYKMEFYMANASAFCYFAVDNVLITYQDTDTVQVCENVSRKGSYPRGFNGQERVDEVSGKGNSYTAEFWQYDSRLGRRWNIDPVIKEYESPYAAFANNPIWFVDPNGADTSFVNSKGEYDQQAKNDFMTAFNKVKNTMTNLHASMSESLSKMKSFDINSNKGRRKIDKEMKKFENLSSNYKRWNLLKSDFDNIISKDSPLITYSSDASNLEDKEQGKFSGNYTNGTLESGTIHIRAGRYSTYVHENRHVGQLPTMQVFDSEIEAFRFQQIFSYSDVEESIENSYRNQNPSSDKNIPRPSNFGIEEMVKINYEKQIKDEKR